MASEGGNSNGGTSGTGTKSEQDPKEGKRFFNFVFNVNKKVTDETEMTQDFMNVRLGFQGKQMREGSGDKLNLPKIITVPDVNF